MENKQYRWEIISLTTGSQIAIFHSADGWSLSRGNYYTFTRDGQSIYYPEKAVGLVVYHGV